MRKLSITLFSILLLAASCNDKISSTQAVNAVNSDTSSNTSDTLQMLSYTDWQGKIDKYRDTSVKIKKNHISEAQNKSTLWASVNIEQLRDLLDDQSITHIKFVTAAYNSKKPTMLIMVIRNNKMDQPAFYPVADEGLCPDPTPCP